MVRVGIIGGSGLDDPKILQEASEKAVETPYGKPSSVLTLGQINGTDVVLMKNYLY